MPIKEELEATGNWLFKRRSWIPLVLYPLAFFVIYEYKDSTYNNISDPSWSFLCLSLSLLGLIVRAITIGFTPRGTSGRNTEKQIADKLNQTGMYSVVRHPLYLGNFLMWLGLFLYIGLWWFVTICSLLYWIYYERIMLAEEEFLRKKYSKQYEQWALNTPVFIPKLKCWKGSQMCFSFRNVLKREYNGFFALAVSFTAINALSNYITFRVLTVDFFWQVFMSFSLLIFMVLRYLKKKTKILEVEGR